MTRDCTNADRQWLQRVSDWHGPNQLQDLDDELLIQLTRSQGIDFATAVLYRAICQSTEHGPLIRRLEELLRDAPGFQEKLDATFVIAPGAFYREHPETGADGQRLCRVAESLGCRTQVIATHSVGSSTVNGQIIRDWLRDGPDEPIVLCSLSKGGADVKMALAQPDARHAFRNVVAWLNVGGTTDGSPIARWVLEHPLLALLYRALFWWRGQDPRFLSDLDRRAGSLLDFAITAPPQLKVIHVLGFPLTHHIRRQRTRRWHRRLACYGPNDGATILADSCRLPGLIFPVWGADHYFDTGPGTENVLAALLIYLAEKRNLLIQNCCELKDPSANDGITVH
jgi:hypothetical protein